MNWLFNEGPNQTKLDFVMQSTDGVSKQNTRWALLWRFDTVPRQAAAAISLAAVLVLSVLSWLHVHDMAIDDAYITYRYILNLLEHHELVWNLGQRVEGETSLLWPMLIGMACELMHAQDLHEAIPRAAVLLAFGLYLSTGLTLWLAARRLGASYGQAAASTLLLQCAPDVTGFSTNGLESMLFACLLALMLLALLSSAPVWVALFGVLLFATRPEGAPVAALMLTLTLLHARPRVSPWPGGLVLLAGLAGVELFRLSYYGTWIPNSVIAKSTPLWMLPHVLWHYGLPYLLGFVSDPYRLILTMAVLASMLQVSVTALRARKFPAAIELLPPLAALWTLSVTLRNGGDWMPRYRLILQYYPLFLPAIIWCLQELLRRSVWLRAIALAALAASTVLNSPHGRGISDRFYGYALERISRVAPPGAIVSSEAAGFLPFELDRLQAHDPMGLLDVHLAQLGSPSVRLGKYDLAYTLFVVKPDFALFHYANTLVTVDQRRLDAAYEMHCVQDCDRCGQEDGPKLVLLRRETATPAELRAFADKALWSSDCLQNPSPTRSSQD